MLLRFLFVLALVAAPARAHDPGLSDSQIAISERAILVQLHIDPGNHGSTSTTELVNPIRLSIDGRELSMLGDPKRAKGRYTAHFRREPGQELQLEVLVFDVMGAGHKHYLRVEFSESGNLFETILTARDPAAQVQLPDLL